MDSVILHEIAISLLSLSLPTHAYRLEISPRWQWPDLASIRPPHISIVALRFVSQRWQRPLCDFMVQLDGPTGQSRLVEVRVLAGTGPVLVVRGV